MQGNLGVYHFWGNKKGRIALAFRPFELQEPTDVAGINPGSLSWTKLHLRKASIINPLAVVFNKECALRETGQGGLEPPTIHLAKMVLYPTELLAHTDSTLRSCFGASVKEKFMGQTHIPFDFPGDPA